MQKLHDRKNVGKVVLDPAMEPKPKPATPAKTKSKKQISEEKKKEDAEKKLENGDAEEKVENGDAEKKENGNAAEEEVKVAEETPAVTNGNGDATDAGKPKKSLTLKLNKFLSRKEPTAPATATAVATVAQ